MYSKVFAKVFVSSSRLVVTDLHLARWELFSWVTCNIGMHEEQPLHLIMPNYVTQMVTGRSQQQAADGTKWSFTESDKSLQVSSFPFFWCLLSLSMKSSKYICTFTSNGLFVTKNPGTPAFSNVTCWSLTCIQKKKKMVSHVNLMLIKVK